MDYSVEYCVLQRELSGYYKAHGTKLNYPEMSHLMLEKGLAREGFPAVRHDLLQVQADEEFLEAIRHRYLPVFAPFATSEPYVAEMRVFPSPADVYAIQQLYNVADDLHMHDYFEVVYVFSGSCTFNFEKKQHVMQAGELLIIAPDSLHSLCVPDVDSVTIIIWLRKSTFNSTFFSLLSRRDLLSYFFQTILYKKTHSNYLLFFTDNSLEIKGMVKHLFLNCIVNDAYSNSYSVSMINVLFAAVLRNYSKTIEFYDYHLGADFSLILQYIQNNYLNLTLKQLAEMFHYSQAHLSVLIKKNTNRSYSDLITHLKLTDATDYLANTDLKVTEIAYMTGYNSPDHFSRTFRHCFNMSPSQYRLANKKNQNGQADSGPE